MRVLLDECVPRKFKFSLAGHHCFTVPETGLAGAKNGALLSAAESAGFDVFITIDRGFAYQQNLTGRRIAIVLIRTASNRLADVQRYAHECAQAISSIEPGRLIILSGP